jgi:NAD(P)-dependent dehydrogenase (short-subunit alcohol dehydrogenase family)
LAALQLVDEVSMGRLSGKVALVTGAGSGIGRSAAVLFAREGAQVVIGNRDERAGAETVRLIRAAGGEAAFLRTDVAKPGDAQKLVDLAVSRYGGLHVAFNNAGTEGRPGPLIEAKDGDYDAVFDVNVRGVWLALRAEVPALVKSGGGAIVNNSSVLAVKGFAGATLYSATKGAVEAMTRSLAVELVKAKVRVNNLAPGPVATPMTDRFSGGHPEALAALVPIGRIGTPEEQAEAALFLASDAASFITGQTLTVDGGLSA